LRIPPGHQRFEFHYTGLSFVAPDKVRFRHMLDGMENTWVEAGMKRAAEYIFLPPGTYTFRANACNNDGLWNPTGAAITFRILPYFWQTLSFRIGVLIAGAGALAGSIFWAARLRLRRKLEQLERQRALERERTRIARDIHDDLGSSLTRITMLSQSIKGEIQAQPEAAADVDQIYSTAREITRAMDEIVWAVNPKYDTLDSLAAYVGRFSQQYLSAAGIRCRLHMPVQLPALALSAEVRHNVFLAFKEALNNIVKHAQATEVSITLNLETNQFVLLLVDNGQGLEAKDAAPIGSLADNLRSSSGHGLLNMKKRMEEIGGSCGWDSALGEGTRVTLKVVMKP
jgi:signal transduction histidine kinase